MPPRLLQPLPFIKASPANSSLTFVCDLGPRFSSLTGRRARLHWQNGKLLVRDLATLGGSQMKYPALLITVLLCFAPLARAADLAKIERKIAKEPAYQTKTPKYCLLVFGAEAKSRVWLVQDGDTLYVDRNGNGDLTEDGKRVTLKQQNDSYRAFDA